MNRHIEKLGAILKTLRSGSSYAACAKQHQVPKTVVSAFALAHSIRRMMPKELCIRQAIRASLSTASILKCCQPVSRAYLSLIRKKVRIEAEQKQAA